MEVLITHGWSEQNTGDYAIENSIMNVIEDASEESVNFKFYSLFDRKDRRLLEHNSLKLQKPNVGLIPSFWGTPPIQYSQWRKVIYILFCFIQFLCIRFFLIFGILIDKRLQKFKAADLVVVKGGTFIYTVPGLRGVIFGLRILFPIMLAVSMKRKIIIAPHSFGPFQNKWIDPLIFKYLKKLDHVYCRENESVDILKKHGVQKCSFLPDMAFYNVGFEKKKTSSTIKIGITARPLKFLIKEQNNTYRNYISALVDYMEKTKNRFPRSSFFLIPQVIGPDPREDDTISLDEIYQSLNPSTQKDTEILEGKLREPKELIEIYSQLDLLVGTRMHSVIFGLLSAVKPIAVSYLGPKHSGIMKSFNLEEYVTDIRNIKSSYLFDKTQKLLNTDISSNLKMKSLEYKNRIYMEFKNKIA